MILRFKTFIRDVKTASESLFSEHYEEILFIFLDRLHRYGIFKICFDQHFTL